MAVYAAMIDRLDRGSEEFFRPSIKQALRTILSLSLCQIMEAILKRSRVGAERWQAIIPKGAINHPLAADHEGPDLARSG